MSEWVELSVAELGEMFDGPHATPTRTTEGPYFLNISSLSDGRLDLNESDHVSEEDFKKWTRRVSPREGDLLFSYETRLGDAALMPAGIRACLGRRMALIRPSRSIIDPRFLLYLYLSPQFQSLIQTHTIHGATVNRISLSTMPRWRVALPVLSEQAAIAEVLGALDDKIAANTKLSETTQEFARTTFLHALRAGSERTALSSIAVHVPGRYLKRDEYVDDGPYLVHGSNSVMGRHDKYMVGGGFAVLARIGSSCGQFAWSESPAWINNNASGIVPQPNIHPLILRFALAGVDMNPHRGGSGQPFIRMDSLFRAEATVPAMSAQGTLGSELQAVVDVEHRLAKQSSTLANLRDTLLPQLMTGKLRVRDAERTLDEVL